MQIKVKFINGTTEVFDVEPTITVKAFKKIICNRMGITDVRLIFSGKMFEDDKKLAEYPIHVNTNLTAITRQPETEKLKTFVSAKPESNKGNTVSLWIVENNDPLSIDFNKIPESFTFYPSFSSAIQAADIRDKKNKRNYASGIRFNCSLQEVSKKPVKEELIMNRVTCPTLYKCNNVYYFYTLNSNDSFDLIELTNENNNFLKNLDFSNKQKLEVSETKNPEIFKLLSPHYNYIRKVCIKAIELTLNENTHSRKEVQALSENPSISDAIVYSTQKYYDSNWNLNTASIPLVYEQIAHFEQGSIELKIAPGIDNNDPRFLHFEAQVDKYIRCMPPAMYFENNSSIPSSSQSFPVKDTEFSTNDSRVDFRGFIDSQDPSEFELAYFSACGQPLADVFYKAYLAGEFTSVTVLEGINLDPTKEGSLYERINFTFSKETFATSQDEEIFIGKIQQLFNTYQSETNVFVKSKNTELKNNNLKCITSDLRFTADKATEVVKEFSKLLKQLPELNKNANQSLGEQKEIITEKLFNITWEPGQDATLSNLLDKISIANSSAELMFVLSHKDLPPAVRNLAKEFKANSQKYYTDNNQFVSFPTVTPTTTSTATHTLTTTQQRQDDTNLNKHNRYDF